jgi:hypothetical protein
MSRAAKIHHDKPRHQESVIVSGDGDIVVTGKIQNTDNQDALVGAILYPSLGGYPILGRWADSNNPNPVPAGGTWSFKFIAPQVGQDYHLVVSAKNSFGTSNSRTVIKIKEKDV